MKKNLLSFKTMLLGIMMLGGVANGSYAACSVATDAYGKTKVVWDFGIEAKAGGTTYYLDASTNGYVESSAYPTATNQRSKFLVSQINVDASRSITSNDAPDSGKGPGVILGKSQGYITIYAPISGTLSLTGTYLSNVTVTDKSDNKTLTNNGSSSVKVTQGHRIQLTASGGCGVATMTITPDDYDTDVVASGDWNFAGAEVIRPSYDITGTNIISTKGYKSGDKTTKDVFVVAANSDGSVRIHPNEEATGLKLAGGAEFDFTSTNAGYLTITYNYGGTRGSWYIKDGSNNSKNFVGKRSENTVIVWLAAGYRAQFVTGTGSNTSVLITNVTFTEGSPVTATMGKYGYTTFASTWNLDLGNLPEGLKAYYVTSEGISKTGGKVTMTEATGTVAAGTGLMLKGSAGGEYRIPVASTGTDLSSTNKLIGCTGSTEINSSTENYANFYVLVNTETQAELQNIYTYVAGGSTVTIPAGKAYLDATGVSSARLMIAFDDEATGISEVCGQKDETRDAYYNLSGQRLSHPIRGMYIRDGKKIMVK